MRDNGRPRKGYKRNRWGRFAAAEAIRQAIRSAADERRTAWELPDYRRRETRKKCRTAVRRPGRREVDRETSQVGDVAPPLTERI